MTQLDPIQAQLIAARRNQILDAATQVFAEKGFHRATIRDVAKVAGIADGTIYNYFENKPAILIGILDRLNETPDRESHFEQVEQVGLREWMTAYFKQRFEKIAPEGLQVFQVVLSEVLTNQELRDLYMRQVIQPTFELAERYHDQWVANGTIKPLNTALTMRALAGMTIGLLMLRLLGDPELNAHWDELPAVLTELVLNGLSKGNDHE